MLEGTGSLQEGRAASLEIGRDRTRRRPDLEARRRDLLARLAALSLAGIRPSSEGDPGVETEATAVARAWLELVDSGRYAASWTATAPVLQHGIDDKGWELALRSIRARLGRCRSRTLRSRRSVEAFPGVPAGPYVVIRFESRFEQELRVVETVTTHRGDDDRWRVAAYFVGEAVSLRE